MNYWLFKSEPEEFSIDDLARVASEPWTGVRNYQARNFLRDAMRVGDRGFFYHSNCAEPGIVGILKIVAAARPDPTQFDPRSDYFDAASPPTAPRWVCVDVAFEGRLQRVVSLRELQQHAAQLDGFPLIRRGNRLSILPVGKAQWDFILRLSRE
ncbi:MAG: EVE domain-containing protein [Lysobacterales bacterium]